MRKYRITNDGRADMEIKRHRKIIQKKRENSNNKK